MNSNKLSVLSLNCWGLNIVSKKRRFRLCAIADAISNTDYDIVALQELWMPEDFEYLKQQTQSMLPYANLYYSGALGSGLAILSRYPIVSTSYSRYTLAGRPLKIFHGDFYVGKGYASACVDHPDIGIIEVFNTHLHAGYGDETEYEGHRLSETWELARRLRASAAQGRQVIVSGDFNSVPTSHNYQLLKLHAYMTDSWMQANQQQRQNNQIDTDDMIQYEGITCNSPMNSWSKNKARMGDRLDYIFYRMTPQLQCIHSNVAMTEYIPGTQMSYSDHFAVHSTFAVHPHATAPPPQQQQSSICHHELNHPAHTNLDCRMLEQMRDIFKRDQEDTRKTANMLLVLFVVALVLVIFIYAVLVALPTTLQQHYDGNLVTLLVTLLGGICVILMAAFATICLIVGFVFGRTEQRALRQFVADADTLLNAIQRRKEMLAQRHDRSPSNGNDSLLALDTE
ncbi:DNase I-like protein [Lichtheimia hyalospora FSU 10163]|nr:DNase I-like protein [Lichtheimia hyalospora FSU 10163]